MRVNDVAYRTVWMEDGLVKMIDQRELPFRFEVVSFRDYRKVARAIADMTVRGAGAIGVAAGYGMALAALHAPEEAFDAAMAEAASVIGATRPTARNLFYAIERVLEGVRGISGITQQRAQAVAIAQALSDEDAQAGQRIGQIGEPLLRPGARLMTHCNAGWLAFADWGTALAPVYQARRRGKPVSVWVTETRPRAQGAKLTTWELAQEGIPHTVIPDTAVGHVMRQGLVDLVIVGADRIAANGDVANKIGTYTLAVLAQAHHIPFYVAAPTSTIDLSCPDGAAIPIEERAEEEVLWSAGIGPDGRPGKIRITPEGSTARNWAFDVTPAALITGLLTERGLINADPAAISQLMRAPATPSAVPASS